MPYTGAAFLYADGRLIWNEYFGEGYGRSTGWLEQSLTDEGIELVRALALGTTDDGHGFLDPEMLPGLLPDRAWVDQAVRPYVPSGFAACLFVTNQEDPFIESDMTQQEMLAALPRAARDLLRDRPFVRSDAYGGDSSGGISDCLGLDVADARRLDRALRAAGYEQEGWRNRYLLQDYAELDPPEAGTWWLERLVRAHPPGRHHHLLQLRLTPGRQPARVRAASARSATSTGSRPAATGSRTWFEPSSGRKPATPSATDIA